MKKVIALIFFFNAMPLFVSSTVSSHYSPLLVGTIQYPSFGGNSTQPPSIYCSGAKIETHQEFSGFSFYIPRTRQQKLFYLLIYDKDTISFAYKKNDAKEEDLYNTFDHFFIDPHSTYKMFELEIVEKNSEDENKTQAESSGPKKYCWRWRQVEVPEDGKVPDRTIIVICSPESVKALSGGTELELPAIIMEPSGKVSTDAEARTQLASINYNTLHTACAKVTYLDERHPRTLLVASAS